MDSWSTRFVLGWPIFLSEAPNYFLRKVVGPPTCFPQDAIAQDAKLNLRFPLMKNILCFRLRRNFSRINIYNTEHPWFVFFNLHQIPFTWETRKKKLQSPNSTCLIFLLFWQVFTLRTTFGCMILARCCYIFRIFQKLCLSDWCGIAKTPRVDDVLTPFERLFPWIFSAKFWKWEEKTGWRELFFKSNLEKEQHFLNIGEINGISNRCSYDSPEIRRIFTILLMNLGVASWEIATSRPTNRFPPKWWWKVREIPGCFQGNLGWWSIIPFGQIAGLFVCWFFWIWGNVCLHTFFLNKSLWDGQKRT